MARRNIRLEAIGAFEADVSARAGRPRERVRSHGPKVAPKEDRRKGRREESSGNVDFPAERWGKLSVREWTVSWGREGALRAFSRDFECRVGRRQEGRGRKGTEGERVRRWGWNVGNAGVEHLEYVEWRAFSCGRCGICGTERRFFDGQGSGQSWAPEGATDGMGTRWSGAWKAGHRAGGCGRGARWDRNRGSDTGRVTTKTSS